MGRICELEKQVKALQACVDELKAAPSLEILDCPDQELIDWQLGTNAADEIVKVPYFSVQATQNANATLALTTTPQVLPFNVGLSTSTNNAAEWFAFAGGVYTYLGKDIVAEISFSVSGNSSSTARSSAVHRIYLNGNPVTWSTAYSYHRTTATDNFGTASKTFNLDLSAGDTIDIRSAETGAGDTVVVRLFESHLKIDSL